jgi:predicted N-formylglutamate amidohydrolase
LLRNIRIGIVGPLLIDVTEKPALIVAFNQPEVAAVVHANWYDHSAAMGILHLFIEVQADGAERTHFVSSPQM